MRRVVSKLFICINVAYTLGYPISREEVQLHYSTYVITMQLWSHEDETATLITQALARCFSSTCTAFLANNKLNSAKKSDPRGLRAFQ